MAWPDDGNFDAWLARCKITFESTLVLEGIPFGYIRVSDLPAEFLSRADSAGDDVRFAEDDGETECAAYVVPGTFNLGTPAGAIFVRLPGLSTSVDTEYYLYWDNIAATRPAKAAGNGRNAVFSGCAALYGLAGTESLEDWTGVNGNLTELNAPTAGVSLGIEGLPGYGVVAASSQGLYLDAAPHSGLPVTMLTFFEANDADNTYVVSAIASSASNTSNRTMQLNASGSVTGDPVQVFVHGGGGSNSNAATSTGISINTTYMAGGSRDGTSGTTVATINGGNSGTNTGALSAFGTSNRFAIGFRRALADQAFHDGTVGLTLIDNAVLSLNWQATFYAALTNASFYVVGAFEEGDTAGGETDWLPLRDSAQSTGDGVDWTNIDNASDQNSGTASGAELTEEPIDPYRRFSEYLYLTNADLSTVAPGATGVTLQFRIRKSADGGGHEIQDSSIHVFWDGTRIGNSLPDITTWGGVREDDYTGDFGVDETDLSLDSTLGVAIRAVNDGGTDGDASVYEGWMKVLWTGSSPPSATYGNFFMAFF